MGSLMGGWDSPVCDPNLVEYRRNKSSTKEEIESFWKSKKLKEEEHLRDISLLSPRSQQNYIFEEATSRNVHQGADSESMLSMEDLLESDTSLEKILHKNGWWMSSNSAFLNEPPVMVTNNGTAHAYAPQYHVADVAGSPTSH